MDFTELFRCFLLTITICLSTVDALMFHLSPNQRKCLKEEIHKDVLVTGEYEMSDAPGQIATLKASCHSTVPLCEGRICSTDFIHTAARLRKGPSKSGGSKNRNPRNPPKFAKSSVFNRPVVSATCLNQQRQPPTLSGWHTWTVMMRLKSPQV